MSASRAIGVPSRHARATIAAGAVSMLVATAAQGTTVNWTSWTAKTSNTVSGSVLAGSTMVDVTYSGAQYSFAQINGVGTNYWSPTTPTSARR